MENDLLARLKDILQLPEKATEESVIRKVKKLQKDFTNKTLNSTTYTKYSYKGKDPMMGW